MLSFWHTQQIIIMGRFPLSLYYALLPLPFYFFERLSSPGLAEESGKTGQQSGRRDLPGSAGPDSPRLRLLGHRPAGGVRGAAFVWYCSARTAAGAVWSGGRGCLCAGGLVFGAYLILPMSLERDYTGLYQGMVNFASVPIPTWQHVLAWSNYRFWVLPPPDIRVNWYGGYLGLSLAVLVAGGVAAALRSRSRELILRFLPGVCAVSG